MNHEPLLQKHTAPSASEWHGHHIPVLSEEVLEAFNPMIEGVYLDATFGGGGHSQMILQHIGPKGKLIALDRDIHAIQKGQELVQQHPERLLLIHSPFGDLKTVLEARGIKSIQGALFDLGVSSRQLEDPQRGFSFQYDGPLDMRMDQSPTNRALNAATIVNTFSNEKLTDIFFRFGEEPHARRIARAIVQDRKQQPFVTTRQLAGLLERIIPRKKRSIHPATRVFQALRIAVNQEMDELQKGLKQAIELLAPLGKLAVISFHSLEDRIVKQTFRKIISSEPPPFGPNILIKNQQTEPIFQIHTRKPLFAKPTEVQNNPRSRSARMRVLERLIPDTRRSP